MIKAHVIANTRLFLLMSEANPVIADLPHSLDMRRDPAIEQPAPFNVPSEKRASRNAASENLEPAALHLALLNDPRLHDWWRVWAPARL